MSCGVSGFERIRSIYEMDQAIRLPAALFAELFVYARESPEEECCGILIGTVDTITRIMPCRNLHPQTEDRYLIDPADYSKAERYCWKRRAEGIQIIGFWHTHPQGPAEPSKYDLAAARELFDAFRMRYLYIILSLLPNIGLPLQGWRLCAQGLRFDAIEMVEINR